MEAWSMPKQGWAGRCTSNTLRTAASLLNVSFNVVRKLRSLIFPSTKRFRPMGFKASFMYAWVL
jgi:hypothetical protein